MATANPNFDVQQQALRSLDSVHRICLFLEFLQVMGSVVVLVLGYLSTRAGVPITLHLYGMMIYFFLAIFSHVVVYYVLLSITKNVQSAHKANPGTISDVLVIASNQLQRNLLPFILVHVLSLFGAVGYSIASGLVYRSLSMHLILVWVSFGFGLLTATRVFFTLRTNANYMRSFVTSGGFRDLITVIAILIFSSSCSQPKIQSSENIVVVATSDFHGSFDYAEGLASVIRNLKKKHGEQMLYLDGGDLFQGSLEANLNKGRSVVEFYNHLPIDAAAIGNHEIDYGPDVAGRISVKPYEDGLGNFKARAKEAKFRWISANWIRTKDLSCKPTVGKPIRCNALGQPTVFEPRAIFQRARKKVCVIGATTVHSNHTTNPQFTKGTRYEALEKVIQAEAKFLKEKEKCDFILLVAHAGLSCSKELGNCLAETSHSEILKLLNALPPRTLDAVVAGHTHEKAQEVIRGTPVIEAGSNGKAVGVLHLGKNTHHFEKFISVSPDAKQPDITEALKPYRDGAKRLKAREVGHTSAVFARNYYEENPLINLLADVLRLTGSQVQDAQMALFNAGGVRVDLPKGTLTYGEVFQALPYDNSLTIVELKGSELRRILEIAFSGRFGSPGISGLQIKKLDVPPGRQGAWSRDLNGDGRQEDWERQLVVEVRDDKGKLIEDQKTYRLATIDFLVMGGDHQNLVYDKIPAARKHIHQGIWIRDILVEHMTKITEIRPEDYFNPDQKRIELVPPPAL